MRQSLTTGLANFVLLKYTTHCQITDFSKPSISVRGEKILRTVPTIRAAKKDLRKSEKRRVHNLTYINKFKKIRTQIRKLLKDKKGEDAKKLLPSLYKVLDKGVKESVFKKNTASRYKSRITKSLSR